MELELTQTTVRVSSRPADAAIARLIQGTKVLTSGGLDKLFQQTFRGFPKEKLLQPCACYISTNSGPLVETLYISTKRLEFCSDSIVPSSILPAQSQKGKDEPDFGHSLSDNISLRHKDAWQQRVEILVNVRDLLNITAPFARVNGDLHTLPNMMMLLASWCLVTREEETFVVKACPTLSNLYGTDWEDKLEKFTMSDGREGDAEFSSSRWAVQRTLLSGWALAHNLFRIIDE
ncbi:hypothetical protein JHK86_033861 [Glycine max]|nr:hypothetical protein JHK86_033861 [Glycine max]